MERYYISLNTSCLKSHAILALLRKFLHMLFYIYLLHSVCLCLTLWPLILCPIQRLQRCKASLLSARQLCCSEAVKAFDHRTKAVPGFKECRLRGNQRWRGSCDPLILGQISCLWRAKWHLSMGSFPHPTTFLSILVQWECSHIYILSPKGVMSSSKSREHGL